MCDYYRLQNMAFYAETVKGSENFADFKAKATKILGDKMLTCYLNRDCVDNCDMSSDLRVALEHFIDSGRLAIDKDEEKDWYRKELKDSKKRDFIEISKHFTFKSKEEEESKLPAVWGQKDDYIYNFLNYAHIGLCFSDDNIAKRYEVAFEVDKNKIEIGSAGYSEKLDRELPFYITYFDSKPILIDPIEGRVFKFHKIKDMVGLEKVEDMVVVKHKNGETTPLVKAVSILGLMIYEEMTLNTSDMRKSEREVKRAAGKKVKETPWRTVQLGYLRGSLSCIREHSLIALMVYGLEIMKFAIMEGSSIMTVDHINSKHDDNRIDNFALLTRSANDSKGSKVDETSYYFDFFPYFMNSVVD